jgi:hypothetical protein
MKLTEYQTFEIERIKRSQIKKAKYNPRFIEKDAEKRLKKSLNKKKGGFGLLETLVWNKETGNLVAGHQRLTQLDILEKYPKNDYMLDVASVSLSERDEIKANVQLNNPSLQGEFDLEELAELSLNNDISFESMGFSDVDIEIMFSGDSRFNELFEDSEEVTDTKEKLKDIKKDRSEMANKMKEENSASFYFFVVCNSKKEKEALLKSLKVPIYEEYVSGRSISEMIG